MADINLSVIDPITASIVAIMDAVTRMTIAISATQTVEQQALAWDRWFKLTEPLFNLLIKLEGGGK